MTHRSTMPTRRRLMKDRRDFLNTCALGAAALVAPTRLMAAGSTDAHPSRKLSKAGFEALMNANFRCLSGRGEAQRLTLTEVRDGPQSPGLEQFGLLLRGTDDLAANPLTPALYRLYHPETGAMLVHLTPSDSVAGSYIAQFGLMA
ncbi:MAG: twin-arginine translocation signal domain-containing protein [Denitromonas halophila]|nr:MAG: twin-arginine translocation signal domain-containing protein [Denitromonas halophila]TVT67112.1 MAG: twin-arginine translocation signal domain-containing protein [Denitromonas halophila]